MPKDHLMKLQAAFEFATDELKLAIESEEKRHAELNGPGEYLEQYLVDLVEALQLHEQGTLYPAK